MPECEHCGQEIDKGFDLCEDCEDEMEIGRHPDGPGTIYGPDGETLYDPWFERQKVQRTCSYCGSGFMGMPSHGVCDRCADILERGGDPCC